MATTAALWGELLTAEEVAYTTVVPPREPRLTAIPSDLHPRLVEALRARGVDQLYEHQVEALEAARRGANVIVSTGTASGKTLAFNLPVLDALATDPKQRTLYLYPTKALAQDQARSLAEFKLPRLRAAIYDGDTPSEQRWQIRKWANLILTTRTC
jgi:DEAD/DEAH box helicase domain-containing protein